MITYKISLFFPENAESSINELRDDHLRYIRSKKNIRFGGIARTNANHYSEIVYIISCSNIDEAEQFVFNDPYSKIVESYRVNQFEQKIPNY